MREGIYVDTSPTEKKYSSSKNDIMVVIFRSCSKGRTWYEVNNRLRQHEAGVTNELSLGDELSNFQLNSRELYNT